MIRVNSIEISRFRGIREGIVRDFADVNLFIGRNNSGKSTVVEGLHRLAAAAVYQARSICKDPIDRSIQQVWQNVRHEGGLYSPGLWYRLDRGEPIKLTADVEDTKTKVRQKISLSIALRGVNDDPTPTLTLEITPNPLRENVKHFLSGVTVFRPEDARNLDIEKKLWTTIFASRQDKTLVTALNAIFNQNAESYSLLPDSRIWLLFPTYSVPLDSQGEGNRAAFRCLMLLAVLRGAVFVAEEIECHQHPGSLKSIARAVCKQAKESEVQLFLPTHSSECVRSFLEAANEAGLEAAVFHLKLDDGLLDATRLTSADTEMLLDTGVDVRFLDLYG